MLKQIYRSVLLEDKQRFRSKSDHDVSAFFPRSTATAAQTSFQAGLFAGTRSFQRRRRNCVLKTWWLGFGDEHTHERDGQVYTTLWQNTLYYVFFYTFVIQNVLFKKSSCSYNLIILP